MRLSNPFKRPEPAPEPESFSESLAKAMRPMTAREDTLDHHLVTATHWGHMTAVAFADDGSPTPLFYKSGLRRDPPLSSRWSPEEMLVDLHYTLLATERKTYVSALFYDRQHPEVPRSTVSLDLDGGRWIVVAPGDTLQVCVKTDLMRGMR